MEHYYVLPLRLDEILKRKRHELCSLQQSIAQHLHLIITTYTGESRFDPDFGCTIWDEDFNNIPVAKWQDNIKASIESSITKQEQRLQLVQVKTAGDEFEASDGKNFRLKRRLNIGITGKIKKTNEPFEFYESIFISPLSTE